MGTWGFFPFENDTANDWAYGLDDVEDLTLIESALDKVISTGRKRLDAAVSARNALGACEVLARLRGRPNYTDGHTEKVDDWVAAHRLVPSAKLISRATAAIDRILGENSELSESWGDIADAEWRATVEDLRRQMCG